MYNLCYNGIIQRFYNYWICILYDVIFLLFAISISSIFLPQRCLLYACRHSLIKVLNSQSQISPPLSVIKDFHLKSTIYAISEFFKHCIIIRTDFSTFIFYKPIKLLSANLVWSIFAIILYYVDTCIYRYSTLSSGFISRSCK